MATRFVPTRLCAFALITFGLCVHALASPILPVYDLVATAVKESGLVHIKGSFRIEHHVDFDMTGDNAPEFFFNRTTPTQATELPAGSWMRLSTHHVGAYKIWLEVSSDPAVSYPTSALVRFDLVPDDQVWLMSNFLATGYHGGGLAVVMGENSAANYLGGKTEWSFAVCNLTGPLDGGPDTNNVLPVGLLTQRSRFAIGSDDEILYLFAPFADWNLHGDLDSKPRYLRLDIGNNFGSENWLNETRLADPSFRVSANPGHSSVRISRSSTAKYLLIYCMDVTDVEGARYFQIGGVIRRV